MSGTVIIIGARSDIAMACAHEFAAAGYDVTLAARQVDTLQAAAKDIELRHSAVVFLREIDALDTQAHQDFVDASDLPDVVISAVGVLGEQVADQDDAGAIQAILRANFEGPAVLLSTYATEMEKRGSGVIVGISSVAGDRGRGSNYLYGSAKAGFSAFLSGMRNRLADRGVHVVTVKPGFVATKMTQDMDLPGALTAQPAEVGAAIRKAVERRKDVIYVRAIWRVIMGIIRLIPERVFKKLSI